MSAALSLCDRENSISSECCKWYLLGARGSGSARLPQSSKDALISFCENGVDGDDHASACDFMLRQGPIYFPANKSADDCILFLRHELDNRESTFNDNSPFFQETTKTNEAISSSDCRKNDWSDLSETNHHKSRTRHRDKDFMIFYVKRKEVTKNKYPTSLSSSSTKRVRQIKGK